MGAGQNFTGNGYYTRFQPGGGAYPVRTGTAPGDTGARFGNATAPGGGTRPAKSAEAALQAEHRLLQAARPEPQLRRHRRGLGGQLRHQIKKQARVFAAVIVLFVVAMGIAGYILSNQRFFLPAWFPFIGTDFYEVKAELPTAQAVVPGQGQTVNIAGVKVGEVGNVELVDGRAVVTMKIQDQYEPIYKDATILLRPKTGLKDMILALDPGTDAAGDIPEGGSVTVAQHASGREPGRGARLARRGHARLSAGSC